MKAVVQRVTGAGVSVDGNVCGSIGKGLCVLLGVETDDGGKDLEYDISVNGGCEPYTMAITVKYKG